MISSQKSRCFAVFAGLLLSALAVTRVPASHLHHRSTPSKSHHKQSRSASSNGASSSRPRAIDDARATEIQNALVKAGYLEGTSGHWDDASADAMRKMQADNGWQTKLIPDSRALIKLGLGANAGSSAESAAKLVAPAE